MSEEHWDRVYATKGRDDVSWYQAVPATSVRLVTAAIPATAAPRRVIDIGAGASTLADELLTRGYDVTVLDVAPSAVASVKARLDDRATYLITDLLEWQPETTYDVWHDRAVFHFLTDPTAQTAYVHLAARAVCAGGAVVMGTSPPTGPRRAPVSLPPVTTPTRWPPCSRTTSSSCRANGTNTRHRGAPSSRSPG